MNLQISMQISVQISRCACCAGKEDVLSSASLLSPNTQPSRIREHLYLGSCTPASDKACLIQLGITHVVNATFERENPHPQEFTYMRVPLRDTMTERIQGHLRPVSDFIHKAVQQEGGTVLVHCMYGVSRSAALVLAHLMLTEHLTLGQAFADVRAKRPQIEPNPRFLRDLRILEKSIFGEVRTVSALTVCDSMPRDAESLNERLLTLLADEAQRHGDHPTRLHTIADLCELEAQSIISELVHVIWSGLEAFGGVSEVDQDARRSLSHLLSQVISLAKLSDGQVVQVFDSVLNPEVWETFKLDVPLADKFVLELMRARADQALTGADCEQLQALAERLT